MLTEATNLNGGKNDFRQNNIGLNDLLKRYLDRSNDYKDIIQNEMKNDRLFWEKRPLTEEMLKYASQDVIYLPYLYQTFIYVCDNYNKGTNPDQIKISFDLSLVFTEAMKCNEYAQINTHVQKLKNGDIIQAFIKNIQRFGVFCSLNLGITGFINHKKSRKFLMMNHKIGDIVDVCVDSIQKKNNKILLRLLSCADSAQYQQTGIEPVYNDSYYDDFSAPDGAYYGPEQEIYDINEDYQEPMYQDSYYDPIVSGPPVTLTQSESYDNLIPAPEMRMYYPDPKLYNSVQYYTSPDLGYQQPFQSDLHNTMSTTYSYQNIRK
jgi:predicted RNA-binding protein with RPS1 domain